MAGDLPTPQSYEQLDSDMLSSYAAKLGIDDFNVGSAVTGFFEVVALVTARASGDIFQILRDFSVDRATGEALKRLAVENGVTPIAAKLTTGPINVIDSSFNKISTKVYAGANPPNIGTSAVKVSDASLFTASGAVYIGRGTPNVEGPLPYTSITPSGGFYILNLSSPTTKFHNLGESVILAQGGTRSVGANTIALSPGVGSSADIQFSVTTTAIILDGETEVDNVPVSALIPGAAANIPAGAIKSFAAPPFPGATVTNALPFTTGADSETDDQLRVRIKRALASKGLGTATAVKSALIGATPSDEQATIVSDSLITNTDGSATVYVDDGTGYEAKSIGVGLESIVDSALGGEQFFPLQTGGRQAPVAKAFLQSTIAAPYDLIEGDTLAIVVGEITYQHVFSASDFRSPGGATAFEVTASINADTILGFEATTSGGGQFVVIRSKTEGNDKIRTTVPTTAGRDAAVQMGFSSNTIETLRLYKNDIPLVKDGSTASVFSQTQQLWSPSIQNGDTLTLSIDDTAPITFTILDTDFIATGLYTSVASTNSLASWVEVFNAKLTGITASIVGDQIRLTSNLGASNRAHVVIDSASTLVTKGMFSSSLGLSSRGHESDFTLDRNTAQFELTVPLSVGDKLSAGTALTEAHIRSGQIPSGNITFAADGHTWLLIDNPGTIIPTGVARNTLLAVSKPSPNIIRYTSAVTSAFSNVNVGDYAIVWSPELNVNDRIEGRVYAFTSTTLDVLITSTEWAAVVTTPGVTFLDGFVVLRSSLAPQKFRVQSGNKSLDQIAQELQAQTVSLLFSVYQEQYIVATTVTMDSTGSVLAVTSDTQGKLLKFADNSSDNSKDSLIAFYDSQDFEAQLPLFIHALFASGTSADPIDSFITSFNSSISLAGRDPNELIGFLHPYGSKRDAQPYGEDIQEMFISGTTIDLSYPNYITESSLDVSRDIRRLRDVDRFYLSNPLDFGHQDTMTVILDDDTVNKSFEIPLYRRGIANTSHVTNPTDFNAYDVDSGTNANFSSAFGPNFDFANFKVLMRAKKVLKPTPPKTAILYRATKWGRSGEKINVGYVYPSSANSPIGSKVTVTSDIAVRINLKSGPVSTTSIDATTQWNITVTPNTPSVGFEETTYTWNGVGTNPALSLSGGEYVNITTQTQFNVRNTGVFRVSTQLGFTPTATSFSVQRLSGESVAESNKSTQVNGAITFYDKSDTTAAEIQTYVTASLADYLSATLVNDGGTDGSGIIVLSTKDDSGSESVTLKDGINWILVSNLSGDPQFVFKKPLDLPTDVGYAFNDGEEIRLIPTTMDQIRRLISVLAVSGFTTAGKVDVVDRSKRLELSTKILGSLGAVQIVGGYGNSYQVPVLDSGSRVDNTYMQISADKIASSGVHSDQWFRLQASMDQIKIAGLSSNTSVTVVGNSPMAGQSTVTFSGRQLNQRYFGKPRHNIRSRGDNFRVEKQGALVCISWDGVGTNPRFVKSPLNFNDTGGGTVNVTPIANTSEADYAIATGNANFTELSIDDLLTVSGLPVPENNGTFVVTGISNNGKTARLFNSNAKSEIGAAFVTGDFVASSGVSEGDTVFFTAPFHPLNQGRYRVIREYNNSIWIENANVIEEEVSLPYNPISLGFDATTSFKVDASNNSIYLNWNGTGTEPSLGNAQMGDIITFGLDFSATNRGNFMVLRSGQKLQEITQLLLPNVSQFPVGPAAGSYFDINSAGDANLYRVWYQTGTNVAPAAGGRVLAMVNISALITDIQVAAATATLLGTLTGLTAVSSGNLAVATTTGSQETTHAVNGTMPAPFAIQILQSGRRTFLEAINPSAVNQAAVFVTTDILQDHRPQMQFSEYEASVAGDKFVVTGNVLTLSNVGSYPIVQTLSRDSAVVTGNMANVTNVSLNGNETAVSLQEGVSYSGYKHVFLSSAQPLAPTRNLILFDTNAQYQKINESASVQLTSLGKLNFSTLLRNGLDSYRYNTGLIAEANRIVYGDPRDPVTYPGVGAAGADIFIREPLDRRVQVSVDIRLLTGAPFNNVSQQVRSSISSLVNSNPVGQSIDISSIISAVRAVPGVLSVAIDSPQFDSTHDLIFLAPGEKARIINSTLDISVNQIGS